MARYDFEEEKKKYYKQNLDEVLKSTSKKWLKLKVRNFAEKFNFKESKILSQIKTNSVVAAFFIKDPARQNFYQTQALAFLNSMASVRSAKLLPSSGKNAFFIIDGKLGKKGDFKKSSLTGNKSIDFEIILNDGRKIYASHKYTKDSGGAQDNQKNDLLNFIRNAKKYAGDKYVFAAIADGDYYANKNVADQLGSAAGGRVVVCSVENFEEKFRDRGR